MTVSLLSDAADALTALGGSLVNVGGSNSLVIEKRPIEIYVSLKAFDKLGYSSESVSQVDTADYFLLLTA